MIDCFCLRRHRCPTPPPRHNGIRNLCSRKSSAPLRDFRNRNRNRSELHGSLSGSHRCTIQLRASTPAARIDVLVSGVGAGIPSGTTTGPCLTFPPSAAQCHLLGFITAPPCAPSIIVPLQERASPAHIVSISEPFKSFTTAAAPFAFRGLLYRPFVSPPGVTIADRWKSALQRHLCVCVCSVIVSKIKMHDKLSLGQK